MSVISSTAGQTWHGWIRQAAPQPSKWLRVRSVEAGNWLDAMTQLIKVKVEWQRVERLAILAGQHPDRRRKPCALVPS